MLIKTSFYIIISVRSKRMKEALPCLCSILSMFSKYIKVADFLGVKLGACEIDSHVEMGNLSELTYI